MRGRVVSSSQPPSTDARGTSDEAQTTPSAICMVGGRGRVVRDQRARASLSPSGPDDRIEPAPGANRFLAVARRSTARHLAGLRKFDQLNNYSGDGFRLDQRNSPRRGVSWALKVDETPLCSREASGTSRETSLGATHAAPPADLFRSLKAPPGGRSRAATLALTSPQYVGANKSPCSPTQPRDRRNQQGSKRWHIVAAPIKRTPAGD